MSDRERRERRVNPANSPSRGIPFHLEKLTEVVPVKVGCLLKMAIPKPQSSWIRKAIIEKLEHTEEDPR